MTSSHPYGPLFRETLGEGPPMLLMHGGLGLDHTVFRPWLDPLSGTVELIYYDHPANGRSTWEGDPEELGHELWVEAADALRSELGHERILLFGHSYGGFLALEYALRHPHRLDALILANTSPVLDYQDAMIANAREKAPDEETFQAVLEALSGPVSDDEAAAETYRRIHPLYFHDYDPATHDAVLDDVRFSALALNRSTFECLPRYDVSGRLEEIDAPTLVLSGADDWIMPPEHAGERLAGGIPGAQHVVFEQSGHWPFVEETERFLDVVSAWLERVGEVESGR